MLSNKIRNTILKTGVMMVVAISSSATFQATVSPIIVHASNIGVALPNTGTTTAVTTANLNMRTGPSTRNSRILTIPKGTQVTVLNKSGSWSQVEFNGKKGYVNNPYLKAATIAPAQVSMPTVPSTGSEIAGGVTLASLHLRSGAGTTSSSLLIMPKGAEVKLLSKGETWSQIEYKGTKGYASNKYIKFTQIPGTGSVVTPTPTPAPVVTPAPTTSTPTFTTARVKVSLNMRSGPGVENSVVLVLPSGASVKVISSLSNGWMQLEYNGKVGYVNGKYLEGTTAPTPVVTPTPTPTPEPEKPVETTPPASVIPPVENGEINTSVSLIAQTIPGSLIIPLSEVSEYEVKTKIAINMRTGAGTDNSIITSIPKGVTLKREELLNNGWVKITYNGKTGYINGSDTYVLTIPVVWKADSEWAKIKRDTTSKSLGVAALENALTQLTKPYQWGAEGPVDYDRDGDTRVGFDCSGLTQWAYYQEGKLIARTTATGYNKGTQIARADIQIGDLIYFKPATPSNTIVSHVAIYMGNNMMLHASSSFKMTTISGVYWDRAVSIVRY